MQRFAVIVTLVLLGSVSVVYGQVEAVRPLFDDVTPLDITLEAPFRELRRYPQRREELDGVLHHRAPSGETSTFAVKVRARGNSRLELCEFPPLRIDFDRDALEGTVFAGQNHLKLVTLCRDRDSYREYLAQEQRIYEAFRVLSDYSFRVRGARIEYVVTDSRRGESFMEPAFFIEEDWEVAQRLGLEVLEVPEVPAASLDADAAALLALFQYLIGNTDWSATTAAPDDDCCHNTQPIGGAGSDVIVLPYDFDHAGLVNADYARPRSHLPIVSVRQRLYRGYCATNAAQDRAVQRFNDERSAIEAVFGAPSEFIEERTRERTLRYIGDFYEVINDPDKLRQETIEQCRQ